MGAASGSVRLTSSSAILLPVVVVMVPHSPDLPDPPLSPTPVLHSPKQKTPGVRARESIE